MSKNGYQIIKSSLENIPSLPGIYHMLNVNNQIIYVGKAKNLKNRLSNYAKLDLIGKTAHLVEQTCHLEYTVTSTETEALLLEAQLIRKFQPKFNILLKDDKSFPYIRLRLDHTYPQILKYHGRNLENDKFFGPFASATQVIETLEQLQKTFKLRSCSDSYFAERKRPCLQYQIGRCCAPCVNKISKIEYTDLVNQTLEFLSGKTQELQTTLAQRMEQLSSELRFEEAAVVRDRIRALSYIQLKSGLGESNILDTDVISIAEYGDQYCIQVFMYRATQFWGNKAYFPLHTKDSTKEEVLESFLGQYYTQSKTPPKEIIINHKLTEVRLITDAIYKLHGIKISVTLPKQLSEIKLVEVAYSNAELALQQHLRNNLKNETVFAEIQTLFHLPELPERIEVYDNSHIAGTFAVGAMVVATRLGFDKKEYRIYNISQLKEDEMINRPLSKLAYAEGFEGDSERRTTTYLNVHEDSSTESTSKSPAEVEFWKRSNYSGSDDYAMLKEVLTRRLRRLKCEPHKMPSLMIIDGGKGHLSTAQNVFTELGFNIPVVCMSKGAERNAGCEQFHMSNQQPFTLDKSRPVMKYLQILRDEAHNFAIRMHRKKRNKSIKISSLDNIPSIGNTRKKALLSYFGSFAAVREASIDELLQVKSISKKIAKTILEYKDN